MKGLSSLAGCARAILDLGRAVGEDDAAGAVLVARYDATLPSWAGASPGRSGRASSTGPADMTAGSGHRDRRV